jgi:raffinose/stachyose/melibiose transport system substrate-binding protein
VPWSEVVLNTKEYQVTQIPQPSRKKALELSRRSFLAAGVGGATLAGLAACSTGGTGAQSGTATLTIWGNHPEWSKDFNEILRAFEAKHDGIKIEASFKPIGDYGSALNTALTGGAAPDIIGLSAGGQVAQLAASGQINNLSDVVKADNFLDESKSQVALQDGVWGAPLALPVVGKFYRPSLFERANVRPPKDGASFLDVLKGLKGSGLEPYGVGGTDAFGPFDLYTGTASAIMGPEGFAALRRGDLRLTDPELLPAAEYLLEVSQYFERGWLNQSIAQAHDLFITGRTAVTAGGTSDLAGFRSTDAKLDVEMFPSVPAAGSAGTAVGLFGNELIYAVNSATKFPKEAATFVGWLASAEAQQIVADRLSLPTIKDVVPADPVKQRMLKMSPVRMPVWWDTPELVDTFSTFAQKGMPMFTKGITPRQMAEAVQSAIKPSKA